MQGVTALIEACQSNELTAVRLLLSKGADVAAADRQVSLSPCL